MNCELKTGVRATWLFWLNFLVLQWFGIRLAREGYWEQVTLDQKIFRTMAFGFYGPYLPLTGWWDEYACLPGNKWVWAVLMAIGWLGLFHAGSAFAAHQWRSWGAGWWMVYFGGLVVLALIVYIVERLRNK
jgi:surface polysaccharide O-acyltransferase-like enzyme